MVANLRALVSKLQTALTMRGRYIFVNQNQYYSNNAGRMVTRYMLMERINGKKPVKLFETYQLVDVVKYLAAQLQGGDAE